LPLGFAEIVEGRAGDASDMSEGEAGDEGGEETVATDQIGARVRE
jgi:hypothetical protein